jgi:hypothetical protein
LRKSSVITANRRRIVRKIAPSNIGGYERTAMHVPSTSLRFILRNVEEQYTIRGWKPSVWSLAPFHIKALCGRKGHARVRVPIANDGPAAGQEAADLVARLPAIGGEQQVDRPVVQIVRGLKVLVDELAGGCCSVREPQQHRVISQTLLQHCRLRRLAAPIEPLEDDQGPPLFNIACGCHCCHENAADSFQHPPSGAFGASHGVERAHTRTHGHHRNRRFFFKRAGAVSRFAPILTNLHGCRRGKKRSNLKSISG